VAGVALPSADVVPSARGRGGGGRARGRPRGSGRGRGGRRDGLAVAPAADGAPAPAPYADVDKDQIHRPAFTKDGVTIPEHEQDWRPSKEVKLDHRSHPVEYFFLFLSLGFWKGCAETSQQYMHKARSEGVKKYPNAKRITIVTVLVFVACLLVNGLNPSPSQDQLFRDESMARGAHRVSDLMTRTRWWEVRAFFHVSDPTRKGGAYERGEAKFDELHKVRPLLDEFQRNAQRLVVPGKTCAMDEITIGFQGHHANLKQRCGKFKRAGDGFQADALVLRGGYVYAFVFRGDNTIPTIPGFSPLHNRCLYLLSFLFGTGLSGFWLFWDNLYPTMKVVAQIALGNALKVTSGRRDWSKKRRPLAVTFDDTVVVPTYGNDDLTQFPKKTQSQSNPYCTRPQSSQCRQEG